MYVHQIHVCYLRRQKGAIKCPGNGVIDGHELPCRCWEWKQGPLQKQEVFLTTKLLSVITIEYDI